MEGRKSRQEVCGKGGSRIPEDAKRCVLKSQPESAKRGTLAQTWKYTEWKELKIHHIFHNQSKRYYQLREASHSEIK